MQITSSLLNNYLSNRTNKRTNW